MDDNKPTPEQLFRWLESSYSLHAKIMLDNLKNILVDCKEIIKNQPYNIYIAKYSDKLEKMITEYETNVVFKYPKDVRT